MELIVEERTEGVLLRPATSENKTVKRDVIDDVIGMLKYDGPPKTIADMQAGIDAALAERWKRKSKTKR
jgi:hypothetical protein